MPPCTSTDKTMYKRFLPRALAACDLMFSRKNLSRGKAAVVAAFLATTMWRNADLYNVTRQDAA